MPTRVREITLRNFKSLGQVQVALGSFTALVGPNGAGKSNFVDAFAFVQECLASSIELAFKTRGGIAQVRRRSGGHPYHIGLRLVLELEELQADYAFEIAAKPGERFRVARERCIATPFMAEPVSFEVEDGRFRTPIPGIRPRVEPDRLALYAASATEEFRPVFDFLTAMRTYSIGPERLRELQEPDPGEYLRRDGSNAAAVLKHLRDDAASRDVYDRLCRLLEQVVSGVRTVDDRSVGQKETLPFKQDVGLRDPWAFDALSMSDGTLRVLGLLLAVHQPDLPSVIGIEEPESTIHPAASELVVQALLDASRRRQILVTTHSPDILDSKEIQDDQIRVAGKEGGSTRIGLLAETARRTLRERLYTAGELLRIGELGGPEMSQQETEQASLFPTLERGAGRR